MATKLFVTQNRDAAHRALEYARGRKVVGEDREFPGTEKVAGHFEQAFCTENPNSGEYYVWDAPEPQTPAPDTPEDRRRFPREKPAFDDAAVEKIVDSLLKRTGK